MRALQYYLLRRLGAGELAYRISRDQAQIGLDAHDGRPQNGLDLADLPPPPRGWVPYSPDVMALFDGETGQFQQVVARQSLWGPYLGESGGEFSYEGRLYAVGAWLDERLPAMDGPHWPLDLYLPNGPGESVAVTDRASGKLLLIEPTLTKISAELTMRPAGSRKAINVAYASATRTLYATDGQSPDLVVIRLQTHELERLYQDVGLASNLVVSLDGHQLYMLIGHGDPAIQAVRTGDMQATGRVLLPGKRFSDVDDPTDLLAISANGRFLAVMTYQDEPAMFTPILSVIDTATLQLLSTSPIKKEEKPVGLAFSTGGRLSPAPSFPDVLLGRELLSQGALSDALRELGILAAEGAKPELDSDVAMLANQGPAGSPAELQALVKPDAAATQRLVESANFKWSARPNMTQADRQSLMNAANDIKLPSEVSNTNGAFVMNWMRDFLGD
ncbi:MAG: hypothetical protein H7338_06305 [Candidatus Sericytochromatia bacterium]|nr:hypothetical protein [Candidatus Sericytochromatia bacterium]